MLVVDNLHSGYGNLIILRGICIAVVGGGVTAILGPNGAGKSTLLNTISGIVPIRKGCILFEGSSIANLIPEEIVKLGIRQVMEGKRIFKSLSVTDNLILGAYPRTCKLKNKEIQKDLDAIFEIFPPLRGKSRSLAGTLSGGMQQMLAIGQALMIKPRVLLLDEPSLGLAPLVIGEIFSILKDLSQSQMAILLVEQNVKAVLAIALRGYIMEMGRIIFEGDRESLEKNEMVRKAYLGV